MFSVKRNKKLKNKESEQQKTSSESIDEVELEKDDVSPFYAMAYRKLHKRIEFLFPKLIGLEPKLNKAGSHVPYEIYISGMVFISLIAGLVGIVVGVVLAATVNITPDAFRFLLPPLLGFALFQVTFGMMYKMPAMSASGKAKKISEEMPYFMGYMATLSSSGLMLEGIFKEIAKEATKEEIVSQCKIISRDIDIFGMDIITAIKAAIEKSPSEPWSELLEGLVSTVESGGNLKEYFTATAKVQMEEKKILLKKMTENLGIVAEMYTILLIVFPLMAIIMLAIMAIMSSGFMGFNTVTLMKGITYLLVPIFGVMLLMMMDSMVPKR